MDNEVVDVVDNNGNVIRQILKTDAHKKGLLHKTVIGYLKYGEDWVLVRQAHDRQDAGQLVAPVGGHVKAGEDEVEALLREAEEEIGTRNISFTPVGRAIFRRNVIGRDENHLFIIFEISTKDKIKLGSESVSMEIFTIKELKQALSKMPEHFGDAFYFNLENFYPDYLPEGWVKRWG